MEKDYTKLIPAPPADLVEWSKKNAKFKGYLFFSCGHKIGKDGKREKSLDVKCSECGGEFQADRVDIEYKNTGCGYNSIDPVTRYEGIYKGINITHGKEMKCPFCWGKSECIHVSRKYRCEQFAWPLVISKVDNKIIAAGYRVHQSVDTNGKIKYTVNKYEAYVYDEKRTVRLTGIKKIYCSIKFLNNWEQRCKYIDNWGDSSLLYPIKSNIFRGTKLANCRLSEYRKGGGRYITGYLAIFNKYPQIENMLVNGMKYLINEYLKSNHYKYSGYYGNGEYNSFNRKAINWRKASPKMMLGLNKPDFEYIRSRKYGSDDIVAFKKLRACDSSIPPEKIGSIIDLFTYHLKSVFELSDNPLRLAKYILKQADKGEYRGSLWDAICDWRDYKTSAAGRGLNMEDPKILFPSNLQKQHDRIIMEKEHEVNKSLIPAFAKTYEMLLPLSWECDGYIIRPAMNEQELIIEGEVLKHCVANYAKGHCTGKPIFFIRKVEDPDMPYYTLNLELANSKILQNRGYRNDYYKDRPKEVTDFAEKWLHEVVKKANITTKKQRKGKISPAA